MIKCLINKGMYKLVIFIAILLATVLLFKFDSGEIDVDDVFDLVQTSSVDKNSLDEPDKDEILRKAEVPKEEDFYDRVYKMVKNVSPFDSYVYGAIVPSALSDAKRIAEFFSKLKETQDVAKFIIIKNGGTEIISPFIQKKFADAEIVSLSVDSDYEDISNLFGNISKIIADKVFVILPVTFSKSLSPSVAEFHAEFTKNVIENFDIDALNRLDADNVDGLMIFLDYLSRIGAKNVDVISRESIGNSSFMTAVFYEGVAENDHNLTVMAFGDIMMSRYVRTLMNTYAEDYVFEKIRGENNNFFKGSDVVFGNFEGPINGEGTSGGTSMVFSFNEDTAPFLKSYGFDVVSIANNHATDQGWDGREKTISAMNSAGLGWCGHPSEADKDSVYYGKTGDVTYAFICFHDVTYKLDDKAAIALVEAVDRAVDYSIVSIHWGYEYNHVPDFDAQVSPGRAFIDAGADFVIGHHPHVVQSFEEYNGKFIFYSLGNFVFDQYWSVPTQEELAIGIVIDGGDSAEDFSTKVYLFPMKSEMSQSRLMTEKERELWIEKFIGYGQYTDKQKTQIREGVLFTENSSL